MTGRFDRLSLSNFTAEDKAVGAAVSTVLAGAVGLAFFNPLATDTAAESRAQAAVAGKGSSSVSSSESATLTAAEAREAGYKVPPHEVDPSEVIDLAKEQVGISEGADGQTKYHEWYVSTPHAEATAERDGGFSVSAYNGAQWCNMFVSWLGAQTGVKNMGWDAYTVQHASWFKDTDRWGKKAKPGSVVFFDWDRGSSISAIDHVGIVVKDNGDGTVSTIEGNTSNEVQKKVRDKSVVVGYGYPDYAT